MQIKGVILSTILVMSLSAVETTKKALRASFETVKIGSDEDLGLLGTSYLIEANEYFYYGFGVYSAVTGKRGGFFVGGAHLGLKYEIYKNFYADAGGFLGGGGGGHAPQGGGLMLKSYLGGLYTFNNYSLGVNYSYVDFPNGDIGSSQVSVVADVKFEDLYADVDADLTPYKSLYFQDNEDYLVTTYQTYFPKAGTKKVSGRALEANMKLLGVEYGLNISKNFIGYVESAGAFGGDSTGYMEILGGLGYSQELFKDAKLQAKLSLGAAGGGEVDTGGGVVSKAYVGFNYSFLEDVTAGVSAGYYHALEGNFDATIAKVQLGLNTHFLSVSDAQDGELFEDIGVQKINIRFVHQTYQYNKNLSSRQNGLDVQLVGSKIDWFVTDGLYLSGQAIAAYKGEAGGYASGLFALGYIQPLVFDFSLVGELAGGAAGGGALKTGEGSVVVPTAGLMYDITKKISLEVMYGKIIATSGDMDSKLLEFGLVYKFGKLVRK